MISWMQHHNKYLVITIWVATIAFIGAGFVGWGAYNLGGNKAATVAKVGNREISVSEFQLAYANNYDYYNQKVGGKLTKEDADKMGLDKIVLQNIINEALLLNFASDLGLITMDSDIKNKLKNNKNFQVNGVFSKTRYYALLQNRQISAKEYENGLRNELLLNKLQAILKLPISKREQEIFTSSLFMQDKLMVGKITIDPSTIQLKDGDVKKFWESTKNNYKTKKQYNLETIKIGLNNDSVKNEDLKNFWKNKKYNYKDKNGKILSFKDAKNSATIDYKLKLSKKKALRTYLKLKKGEIKATNKLIIDDDNTSFPVAKLRIANKGQVLKPIARKNGYLIVKMVNVLIPRVMKFDEAKAIVLKQYKAHELKNILQKRAKARLQIFNGTNLGFVTRDSVKKIEGLSDAQSSQFLNYIFDNKNAQGYKILGNSAILYRVMEQKLLNNDKFKIYKNLITQNIQANKANELNQNLIIKLRGLYKIEQYYKGKGQ
ncbi:MAG: peptidylprolyl isomerase [Epsilonproteobacteria bacterium]|nr:peptidylprolyl isomerase [Campylobacterota bacterium]